MAQEYKNTSSMQPLIFNLLTPLYQQVSHVISFSHLTPVLTDMPDWYELYILTCQTSQAVQGKLLHNYKNRKS